MGNCVNADPEKVADQVWRLKAEKENLYDWLTTRKLDQQEHVMAAQSLGLRTVHDLMLTDSMTLIRFGVSTTYSTRLPAEATDYILFGRTQQDFGG